MAVKPSPTTLRRQLGAELRRLRADRTVADVAAELGWSDSKLSRIETAHTGVRPKDLDRLLEAYAVAEDARARIRALAGQSRQRAWWEAYGDVLPNAYETYIGFEAEAVGIYNYECQVVPGLLQTAEYASAVIQADGVYEDDEVHGQRVAVRMARQAVLTRDPPPQLSVIVDEAVLRRPIGGPDVMRRQLTSLVEANERKMVTVQVLPFAAGAHRALAGAFIILEFARDGDSPLVYSEGMTGGVFRSRPDELRNYWMSFEALRAAALNPKKSVDFISAIVRGEN
ncbi:helix-turn-helix domain-containing protein [Phytohabitans houttuyneae]|uniref:Transcriptional regulator n=1 Tax=Phytohabitans houttuyneae TaxID=1076126 RepID=A0A6V8KSA9_9ACTN|nr:helix-turn-helix transcriptional regulator [Phytohabitans houttuyneae]GFJ84677.1 transcriptional regulator [Phytohabitans houttuyneae]